MPAHPWQVNQTRAKPAIGYVALTGVSADGETLTIGARVYILDPAGSAVGGDVGVLIANGATAADTITALVAAINGDAGRAVDALDIGGNVMALVHRTPGAAGNIALAETFGNGVVSAAAMVGGFDEGLMSLIADEYAVTVRNVAELAAVLGTSEIILGAFPSTTQPEIHGIWCRSATGVYKSLIDAAIRVAQVNANQWALLYIEPAAGAILADTDIVGFVLGVRGV